ncbi:MAG TPA: fatty acid--CoA ligase family protein [Dongiaceae bacterium]|nr:fatty acid--CoA ligase family protein [Dongiaceae bacterium]
MSGEIDLARFVLAAPDFATATASVFGEAPLAHAEIEASARALAAELKAAGAGAHEPVVLVISNRPQDLVGFLGLWLAGCVAAPLHVATPEQAAQALIARLGARFRVSAGRLERIGDAAPPARPLLEHAALIVFTSGSTGQPKGVVVRHQALVWKLQVLRRLLAFAPGDVVVVPLQLTFIFGIWVSLLALLCGSRLVLAPKFSADSLAAGGATVLAAVPTLLRTWSAEGPCDAPHLRAILTGGEPFGPALAERLARLLPNVQFFDLFGLTETGSCDFCAGPRELPVARGTIGRPTEGVAFRIAEVAGLGLPAGVGELQIRTPAVMAGYLDDPAQTHAAMTDGYFRTGDLATLRGDGYVQLVGRLKDVISRGGNKIAPLEIENLFARHESVLAALAFGVPDDRLGESLHLMVVARDRGLTERDLREWARDRLERFKTPDAFHFVDALPAGRTGKADRSAARMSLKPGTS